MAKYISEKIEDPSVNIESLILHDNDCDDKSFSAILESLLKQKKLKNLTYSCNKIGLESVASLDKIFDPQMQ